MNTIEDDDVGGYWHDTLEKTGKDNHHRRRRHFSIFRLGGTDDKK